MDFVSALAFAVEEQFAAVEAERDARPAQGSYNALQATYEEAVAERDARPPFAEVQDARGSNRAPLDGSTPCS